MRTIMATVANQRATITILLIFALPVTLAGQSEPAGGANRGQRLKAFCIDFNWAPGGSNGFAAPGAFAQADPKLHCQWYQDLGVNTIQTFCVSCNGYAWYRRSAVAPVQPGLKQDFLPEIAELAHRQGMRVMGYFCVGANTYWGQKHPEQSYNTPNGVPSAIHIPLTNEYLNYLSACIQDALTKTAIDGFMLDWVFSPPHPHAGERAIRWLECEKQMYAELFGRPFPGKQQIDAKAALEFQRRAVDRCWRRIREAAKSTKPDCILWVSCFDLRDPQVAGSKMFQEVDWLMNEHPDPASLEATRKEKGAHTRLIQCLCGWGGHDPRRVVGQPRYDDVGFYGYAAADLATTLPSREPSRNVGPAENVRNIEILREVFHEGTSQ
jgi:hypothetical protein